MTQGKILVVDDDPEILDLMELILSRENFTVLKAVGGAEGLRLATEEHPDLVLLDIMMPDIDGYEVLEKIKERQIPTRVIMVTAYFGSLLNVIRFIRAGACNYILKPFGPRELVNAVKRALALESTINLNVSDPAPIVEELVSRAIKLEKDNRELRERNRILERQQLRTKTAIRLLYLAVSALVAILFHGLGVVTNTQSLFLLPIILFVLLLLPIERVKNLYTKTPKTETRVEMSEK
ncbi:MAG TPA: response regulator [Anaerolineae bacterium]|nr:response regulator [Anaerolineae bacterium]